jgi:hypothetical protein
MFAQCQGVDPRVPLMLQYPRGLASKIQIFLEPLSLLLLQTFPSNIHVAWLPLLVVCSDCEKCPNMKLGSSHMGTHPKECSIVKTYQNPQDKKMENNICLKKTRCRIRSTKRGIYWQFLGEKEELKTKRRWNRVRRGKRVWVAQSAKETAPPVLVWPSGLLSAVSSSWTINYAKIISFPKFHEIPRWLHTWKLPFIDFGVLADWISKR